MAAIDQRHAKRDRCPQKRRTIDHNTQNREIYGQPVSAALVVIVIFVDFIRKSSK